MRGLARVTGHVSCTRVVESCRSKRFPSHYPEEEGGEEEEEEEEEEEGKKKLLRIID